MWFPSSKTCSVCGTVNRKLKRERMWTAPACGTRHDRNLNAAINLRNLIMPEGRRPEWAGSGPLLLNKRREIHAQERTRCRERSAAPTELERGTHTGTEVEGYRAGKQE